MASKTTELTEQAAADVVDGDLFPFVDLTGPTSEKLSVASVRSAIARLGLNPPTLGIFAINGTTQFNYEDGAVYPETTNDVDLGKTAKLFKNGYLVNLDLGASGVAGTLDVFPTTASKGKLQISVTDQTGDTTVSLAIGAMAAARTITLRDPGAAASILTTTDATAAATAATAVEITRACDVSARLVAVGGTSLAVTEASHSDKIIKLDHTGAASTCTLPAATGTGAVFRFLVTAVNTSNHVVAANGTDVLKGVVTMVDDDSNAATAYSAKSTDDKITLNGTTTGGQIGDWLEFVDIASGVMAVKGALVVPAGSDVADPFSAT